LQSGGGNEELPIETAKFEWISGEWYFLELIVQRKDGNSEWRLEGRVWPETNHRPRRAQLKAKVPGDKLGGKASIIGNPYSGKSILFDDIEVKKIP